MGLPGSKRLSNEFYVESMPERERRLHSCVGKLESYGVSMPLAVGSIACRALPNPAPDTSRTSNLILHCWMAALLDKPERWRKRAEEIRTIADGMRDPDAKRFMLGLAKSYEELAKRAEDRKNAARP